MSKDSREHKARARARDKTEMKFGKVSAGMPFTPTGVSANPRQTVAPATDRYADGAISFILEDNGSCGSCPGLSLAHPPALFRTNATVEVAARSFE